MLIVKQKLEVLLDGEAAVVFRRPTAEQMNAFTGAAYPAVRGSRIMPADFVASCVKLFDETIEEFRNVTHEDGRPFTVGDKEHFPVDWKVQSIQAAFARTINAELAGNSDGTSTDT